jgi:hypothetical protein
MKQLFQLSFYVLFFSVLLFACKKESEVIVLPDEDPEVLLTQLQLKQQYLYK